MARQTANAPYGQYCPLAMSAEFLCSRWTMLILRELLFGSSQFNDICRGVPRMSRTLLSKRLRELEQAGILARRCGTDGKTGYFLTEAGQALEPVVLGMAAWGQTWLKVEPSLKDLDVGLLMWDIRRNTRPMAALPNPFVVEFNLSEVPENQSRHWLIFKDQEVDLCHIDYGFEVDVLIEISAYKLTKVWMGWESMQAAIDKGEMKLIGKRAYTQIASQWLGQSSVGHITKTAPQLRI